MKISPKNQFDWVRKSIPAGVELVAVSKTYPPETILQIYEAGQRIFGENRPQELCEKYESLPKDINWHMIGTLQTNKVKYIAPFVALIHSVDSPKLLETIDKEARKNNRTIAILFEVHIASEATKQGWDPEELLSFLTQNPLSNFPNVNLRGVMGMATFTDDTKQVYREFQTLTALFETLKTRFFADKSDFDTRSMGMSGDYPIAIEAGSTMVRIGSLIFGARN